MKCCETCRFRAEIVKWDYTKSGVPKEKMPGFACLGSFLCEEPDNVIWMVGIDSKPPTHCELYEKRLTGGGNV